MWSLGIVENLTRSAEFLGIGNMDEEEEEDGEEDGEVAAAAAAAARSRLASMGDCRCICCAVVGLSEMAWTSGVSGGSPQERA